MSKNIEEKEQERTKRKRVENEEIERRDALRKEAPRVSRLLDNLGHGAVITVLTRNLTEYEKEAIIKFTGLKTRLVKTRSEDYDKLNDPEECVTMCSLSTLEWMVHPDRPGQPVYARKKYINSAIFGSEILIQLPDEFDEDDPTDRYMTGWTGDTQSVFPFRLKKELRSLNLTGNLKTDLRKILNIKFRYNQAITPGQEFRNKLMHERMDEAVGKQLITFVRNTPDYMEKF
jgi:hypothetical protein